jgi:IS5 family transposase
MKQSRLEPNLSTRKTRKQVFLQQMDVVVPWAALVELIAPHYLESMLRVHFLQQWFNLSDPAMEEAFFDIPLYREFA